ncbi:hypothetical protein PP175_28145 (plasmid) [Aneurinibacillus sp. Ricciae_BoGa-3]|uniref:hypothetical protein n=1 Tax=Aneurinibacillus sp. Ricciae_BoGa-3 TaxID=3022697 RepID=UPI002340684A|nr:hypothetical protein [Aneurinibacillus sp. Ricciae_BoGa-3]WCK57062.1 hypothetical protein PP175_28145 [Aneurinibacillus sp. Ricciae_BoGa-3]
MNKQYKVYGPFGINSRTSIHLIDDEKKNIIEQKTLSITVRPTDLRNGILYYETGEVTNQYADGSLPELNGGNQVIAPLPDTIEEILELL